MEYMSQAGYDELVAELQHMVKVELPGVRDAIAEARDKGDPSENVEYHAAKREQEKGKTCRWFYATRQPYINIHKRTALKWEFYFHS